MLSAIDILEQNFNKCYNFSKIKNKSIRINEDIDIIKSVINHAILKVNEQFTLVRISSINVSYGDLYTNNIARWLVCTSMQYSSDNDLYDVFEYLKNEITEFILNFTIPDIVLRSFKDGEALNEYYKENGPYIINLDASETSKIVRESTTMHLGLVLQRCYNEKVDIDVLHKLKFMSNNYSDKANMYFNKNNILEHIDIY